MNSKIKVDKFVIVAFLLCMVCTMAMQAKAYDNFKVSVYVLSLIHISEPTRH